jgi:isorenieratene synthase
VPLADYPLISADGHTDSFAGIPRTPPLNLAAFVIQSPSFRLRDLAAVNVPAALELLDVDFPSTFSQYNGESAAAFLDRLHFPAGARHLALEVFARSFSRTRRLLRRRTVAMFHSHFLGSRRAALRRAERLRQLPRFHCGAISKVSGSRSEPAKLWLQDASQTCRGSAWHRHRDQRCPHLGTDPATTRRLAMDCAMPDVRWLHRVAALRNAPPFAVWRLWLDRLVADHRPAFLGTSGFGPLDNISVLERFEEGARQWSAAHGGSVVELHAYALVEQPSDQQLKDQLLAELHRVYPELEPAGIVAEEFLIMNDCPLHGTDPWAAAHRGDARGSC